MQEQKVYKRICKFCGKEFETISKVKKFCDGPHYNICEYCGKQFEIKDIHYISRTCSRECEGKLRRDNAQKTSLEKYGVKNAGYTKESQEKIKKTNQERYGVDYAFQAEQTKEKIKESMLEKYGVDNAMKSKEFQDKAAKTNIAKYGDSCVLGKNSSCRKEIDQNNIKKYGVANLGGTPENLEKIKQTTKERYGADYYMQTEEGKERFKQTCIEKYGVPTPMFSEEVKDKMKQNCLKKYGVEYSMQREDVKQKVSQLCMEKYGVAWPCLRPEYRKAVHKISTINTAFAEKLGSLNISYEQEFVIKSKAYDFKIDNLLIELNPTFTHTSYEHVNSMFGPIDKDYHKNKSLLAKQNGYTCIQMFDWDNENKLLNILSELSNRKLVNSSNCNVAEISTKESDSFLSTYYLADYDLHNTQQLGLYYNDELVQVIVFRRMEHCEILTLCQKPSIYVDTGFQLLFNKVLKITDSYIIVATCDFSKYSGTTFEDLGFQLIDHTDPQKIWSKNKEKLIDSEEVDENNMLNQKWLFVYDSGKLIYQFKRGD